MYLNNCGAYDYIERRLNKYFYAFENVFIKAKLTPTSDATTTIISLDCLNISLFF